MYPISNISCGNGKRLALSCADAALRQQLLAWYVASCDRCKGRKGGTIIVHGTFALASFPVPRPAFRRLQYGKAVLRATKSWAMAWERGYLCPSWNSKKSKGTR